MRKIKPYKDGYLLILGNGKVMYFDIDNLRIMNECFNDLRFKFKEDRREFDF
jgi:hypothetical protein